MNLKTMRAVATKGCIFWFVCGKGPRESKDDAGGGDQGHRPVRHCPWATFKGMDLSALGGRWAHALSMGDLQGRPWRAGPVSAWRPPNFRVTGESLACVCGEGYSVANDILYVANDNLYVANDNDLCRCCTRVSSLCMWRTWIFLLRDAYHAYGPENMDPRSG